MNKEFVRVRGTRDYIISLALIILGGTLVALPTSVSVTIPGFFLVFAGILLGIIMKSAYKDAETGEILRKKEMYFPQSIKENIKNSIASNIGSIESYEENQGNGLRVDIYYSQKSGNAYIQLLEYIPYKYEPASEVFAYSFDKVAGFIR